jgi:hypothetical protein
MTGKATPLKKKKIPVANNCYFPEFQYIYYGLNGTFDFGLHSYLLFWAIVTHIKLLWKRLQEVRAALTFCSLQMTSSATGNLPSICFIWPFNVKAQFFQWFRRVASFSTSFEHSIAVTYHLIYFLELLRSLWITEVFILNNEMSAFWR